MNTKEKYALNVQNLMDLIPESTVAKQVDILMDEDEDKVLERQIKWVVGDYAVYSDLHDVYSIGTNFEETLEFILKVNDYKKFVTACKKRRAEMLKQMQPQKKK